MHRFRSSKRYKFNVFIDLISVSDFPIENASLYVKARCSQTRGQTFSATTPRKQVMNGIASWRNSMESDIHLFLFKFPAEIDVSSADVLNRCEVKFQVRRSHLSPNTPDTPDIGTARLDISKLAPFRKPVTRTLLLENSKANTTITVAIYLEQVHGAATYKVRNENNPFVLNNDIHNSFSTSTKAEDQQQSIHQLQDAFNDLFKHMSLDDIPKSYKSTVSSDRLNIDLESLVSGPKRAETPQSTETFHEDSDSGLPLGSNSNMSSPWLFLFDGASEQKVESSIYQLIQTEYLKLQSEESK